MKSRLAVNLLLSLAFALGAPCAARALDSDVRQLIVAVAPDWDSSQGKLWRFARANASADWQPAGPPIPVLFGKRGLAWGRGVLGADQPGLHKQERDGRAPAGVFTVGRIYTYDSALPEGAQYPYRQVTAADAWVDDPSLPHYNEHIVIDDPARRPPWFDKMKMRAGDFAYRWLVEIRHNSDPPEPGAGSAIFFHIRRGETRPTTGCTTMAEANLVNLIRWLRADQRPAYALLPKGEYARRWQTWGLPDPKLLE